MAMVAVVGPSGSGKSLLLQAFAGAPCRPSTAAWPDPNASIATQIAAATGGALSDEEAASAALATLGLAREASARRRGEVASSEGAIADAAWAVASAGEEEAETAASASQPARPWSQFGTAPARVPEWTLLCGCGCDGAEVARWCCAM